MAENKKSFVLYTDQQGIFDKLTDEQAGVLIKHIFKYCNDEYPEGDFVTELAFESIKQQLKRDLKKYEEQKEKQSLKGREGNLKRWHKDLFKKYEDGKLSLEEAESIAKSRGASGTDKKVSGTIANIADNVNVNDNVTVINILFSEFWNLYDKKTGKDKCEKKWKSLKDDERKKIIDVLPKYIDSTPDKQYRKNPITWLNQKCWEDEIDETPKRERTDLEKYLAGEIEAPKIRMGL